MRDSRIYLIHIRDYILFAFNFINLRQNLYNA